MSDRKIIPQSYPLWLIRNDLGKIQKERFLIIAWEAADNGWIPIIATEFGYATFVDTLDPDDASEYEVQS